jgi:hypothetical protein
MVEGIIAVGVAFLCVVLIGLSPLITDRWV